MKLLLRTSLLARTMGIRGNPMKPLDMHELACKVKGVLDGGVEN